MIYWKEECTRLVDSQSAVVVVDHYDENKVPVFAIRRGRKAVGSRSGRNSYWSVVFDQPLSDECTAVTFPFILATLCFYPPHGAVINSMRLEDYHPAWAMTEHEEQELKRRKESVIHELEQMCNDLKTEIV